MLLKLTIEVVKMILDKLYSLLNSIIEISGLYLISEIIPYKNIQSRFSRNMPKSYHIPNSIVGYSLLKDDPEVERCITTLE